MTANVRKSFLVTFCDDVFANSSFIFIYKRFAFNFMRYVLFFRLQ